MTLEQHAQEWDALADREIASLEWDKTQVPDQSGMTTAHYRAQTYRRTATSLRMEDQTGIPHCSCCLKPVGAVSKCERSQRR